MFTLHTFLLTFRFTKKRKNNPHTISFHTMCSTGNDNIFAVLTPTPAKFVMWITLTDASIKLYKIQYGRMYKCYLLCLIDDCQQCCMALYFFSRIVCMLLFKILYKIELSMFAWCCICIKIRKHLSEMLPAKSI